MINKIGFLYLKYVLKMVHIFRILSEVCDKIQFLTIFYLFVYNYKLLSFFISPLGLFFGGISLFPHMWTFLCY